MQFYKYVFALCILFCFSGASLKAQSNPHTDYSNYIYHFIKYMNWPESYSHGDFVIGVAGASPIMEELHYIAASKKAGNRRIVIKNYASVNEIGECHILFVPASRSAQIRQYEQALKNKPTIVVAETSGMAQQGSSISFVVREGKLGFELNQKKAESTGVKIYDELVRLAIPVASQQEQ